MKTVNFGIIGAGRMGNVHAGHLAAISGAKVAGVYDVKAEASQAMHEKYGAKIFNSAAELAAAPEIDCALISSPTYRHIEAIRVAIAAQKPVFCEKPLTRELDDARETLSLLKGYPKLFTVGFVRRHSAKTVKMKELLDGGKIGKLRYCNVDLPLGMYCRMPGDWFADFDKCGGVIIDMLAHHVDLANWFFGEAKSVYAASMLLDKAQPLPSDYVAAVVKYGSGLICDLTCSWQRFGRSNEMMEVYGEKGALTLDGSDEISFHPLGGKPEKIEAKESVDSADGELIKGNDGYMNEMERLFATLSGSRAPGMPSAQDGFKSLEIGIAMIKSAKTNKVVSLPLSE